MPTYDYVCDACGHEWEVFQKISDDKLTDCPACNESAARRKIGAGAGLIFKGSGFYVTDYKGNSKQPAAKGESASSSEGKSAESKSSSTPSEKPATSESGSKSSSEASKAPASKSSE